MSSGSPWPHAANAGEASRPLSRRASFVRSAGGKNSSSSNTPSLRSGGACTWPTRPAQVEVLPVGPRLLHEVGEQDVLAARQRIGVDADQPEQAGHEALDLVGDGLGVGAVGRALEAADDVEADAARRPGRVDRERRRRRAGPGCGRRRCPSRPARPSTRVGRPRAGSPPSTHGANDSAARSGKVSSRLPRSPLGSRISVGHALQQRLLEQRDAEARSCPSRSCRRSRRGW